MDKRGLTGQYSQFVIAGAAIAVIAPKFEAWRPAFWDNLAASVQLHHITKLIAIDHRDCGAAQIAYGASSIADPAIDTETHRKALAEFRKAVGKRQPKLTIETGLMALDGSIQMFSRNAGRLPRRSDRVGPPRRTDARHHPAPPSPSRSIAPAGSVR